MSTPSRPEPDDDHQEQLKENDPGLDIDVLRRRRERVFAFLALFLILAASLYTARRLIWTPPPAPGALLETAQTAVSNAFPPPHVLQFNTAAETNIKLLKEGSWEVTGGVVV